MTPDNRPQKTEQQQAQNAQPQQEKAGPDAAAGKVGSDPQAAKSFGGKGDFGVPVGTGRTRQRDYVSGNTKASDRGVTQPRSSEQDGVRTHGAGGVVSGEGSSSGGDLDTDIIGVGTGGSGVAASGNVHTKPGPDDSTGTSDEFASGKHAKGEGQSGVHQHGGCKQIRGTTISSDPDTQTGPVGQGADAATNASARGDDAFAGEVSSGEAAGEDLPLSPSSDSQGLSQEDNQDTDEAERNDEG